MMKTVQKDKILDVCERLFLQRGISDTSVADIAREVGISKGTLYYHYPSKEAIIYAVADRYFAKTQEALEKLLEVIKGNGITLEEGVKTCLYVLKLKKTTEKMHYILMAYGVMKDDALKDKFKERYLVWIDMIQAALDSHNKSENNIIYSHIIMALFDGIAIKNVIGVTGALDDVETMLNFLKKLDIINKF